MLCTVLYTAVHYAVQASNQSPSVASKCWLSIRMMGLKWDISGHNAGGLVSQGTEQ